MVVGGVTFYGNGRKREREMMIIMALNGDCIYSTRHITFAHHLSCDSSPTKHATRYTLRTLLNLPTTRNTNIRFHKSRRISRDFPNQQVGPSLHLIDPCRQRSLLQGLELDSDRLVRVGVSSSLSHAIMRCFNLGFSLASKLVPAGFLLHVVVTVSWVVRYAGSFPARRGEPQNTSPFISLISRSHVLWDGSLGCIGQGVDLYRAGVLVWSGQAWSCCWVRVVVGRIRGMERWTRCAGGGRGRGL